MRTYVRHFRPLFHRHAALPPRPAPPPDPAPPVTVDVDAGAPPPLRIKAWLRLGAQTLFAVLWVTLPQFVVARANGEGESLVVEVDRPCSCGRPSRAPGPSLREALAPKDDAALDADEPVAPKPRPLAAPGFCAHANEPAREPRATPASGDGHD